VGVKFKETMQKVAKTLTLNGRWKRRDCLITFCFCNILFVLVSKREKEFSIYDDSRKYFLPLKNFFLVSTKVFSAKYVPKTTIRESFCKTFFWTRFFCPRNFLLLKYFQL